MRHITRNNHGFTIVELLIVIVVIGILAAITIVAYNGVTQRANTSSAQMAAETVARKSEAYNSELGSYPYSTTGSDLTADSTKSYFIPSASIAFTLATTQPTTPATVKILKCGTTPNSTQANIISANSNITGLRIYYWTYTGTPSAANYATAGSDTGSGIACPTS
jgi:prepilin-type N-terminal cleavage/methylation domain-containing protein